MNRRDALKYTTMAMGYTLSAGALSTMLQSCQGEVKEEGWQPGTLSKAQVEMLGEVAEVILPKTDTPGAKDVLVHHYIDEYYTKFYSEENRTKELTGLVALESFLNEAKGKNFVDLSAEDRFAVLNELNLASIKAEKPNEVQIAFLKLKGQVISTYFSTEEIATTMLNYNPVPGPFQACVPLEQVGAVSAL